jgi:squalene synthase HpnC
MSDIAAAGSGKGHKDENFPVASLFAPRHRAAVLAFYDFVRAADDISDHVTLPGEQKIAMLDRMEAALLGSGEDIPVAAKLRAELDARGLEPRHAQDLLLAFRRDVTQLRYRDWDDLVDYCRYSAMPVGRFVLDVHGEDRATCWGPNDALCAALQIINHLQDCAKDYRGLDRVYLPQDALAAHGASVEMLSAEKASPQLAASLRALAERTQELLRESAPFAALIADTRLAMEVGAIQRLAETLTARLLVADPLSEKVHAANGAFLCTALVGAGTVLLRRLLWPRAASAASVAR